MWTTFDIFRMAVYFEKNHIDVLFDSDLQYKVNVFTFTVEFLIIFIIALLHVILEQLIKISSYVNYFHSQVKGRHL